MISFRPCLSRFLTVTLTTLLTLTVAVMPSLGAEAAADDGGSTVYGLPADGMGGSAGQDGAAAGTAETVPADEAAQGAGAPAGAAAEDTAAARAARAAAPAQWEGRGGSEGARKAGFGLTTVATPDALPLRPKAATDLSPMERFFAAAPGVEVALRQYGYQMFDGNLAEDVAAQEASVPDDYPLGPGDELILDVPLSTHEIRTVVDRSGTVFVPNFGTLSVAGRSLASFQAALRARAHGTPVTVRLARLRSLTVYLAGQVARPGSYTVSALSTISSLLQQAGGVLKSGSLRRIQLRRNDHDVRAFDFYDFLLKGENAGNMRLQTGDIIFVPSIGPEIAMTGDVLKPAIYELRGEQTLGDVLKLAGGLLVIAYSERVHLLRVKADSGREVLDLDLRDPRSSSVKVRDGDLLEVGQVLNRLDNAITLTGNVERPGVYQIAPETKVSQVVGALGQLQQGTYFGYAQIEREVGPDRHIEIVPFDLGKALAGDKTADVTLQPRDKVVIYSDRDFGIAPSVQIGGAVVRPGSYPLYQNLHLGELINEAGGLLPQADGQHGELARTVIVNDKAHVDRLLFSPLAILAGDEKQDPILTNHDVVVIKPAVAYHVPQTVEIAGEVGQPGTYDIKEGDTLAALIERAGGYLPDAYLRGAVFTRASVRLQQNQQIATLKDRLEQNILAMSAKQNQNSTDQVSQVALQQELLQRLSATQALGRIVVHLEAPAAMREDGLDLQLQAGDSLYVAALNDTVSVLGAVYSPSAFQYRPNYTVEDYLRISGGATKLGDIDNVYVVRADGEIHANSNYRSGWFLFSHGLMQSHLNPGDTIVVPESLVFADPMLQAVQVTQILSQTLSSAASLYGIFHH